jgi:ribosomal-protein-alanine N-acetyltransferase
MQLHSFPVLTTGRLLLRRLSPGDANEIFLLRSDEKHNEFIDRPKATSIEDALSFISKIEALYNTHEGFFWAISLKDDPKLAGAITLWNIDKENNKAELGYELLNTHQGKGIMAEAMAAVLDFCFNHLQLSKLEAWAHPQNIRSATILEKFNFKRDHEAEKQKPADAKEVIYSLTATDHLYR